MNSIPSPTKGTNPRSGRSSIDPRRSFSLFPPETTHSSRRIRARTQSLLDGTTPSSISRPPWGTGGGSGTDLSSRKRDRAESRPDKSNQPSNPPSSSTAPQNPSSGAHDNRLRWNIDHDRSTPARVRGINLHPPKFNSNTTKPATAADTYHTGQSDTTTTTTTTSTTGEFQYGSPPNLSISHNLADQSIGRPGWGSTVVNLVGGMAGKVWNFCKTGGAFTGFRAGGGGRSPTYYPATFESTTGTSQAGSPVYHNPTSPRPRFISAMPGSFPDFDVPESEPSLPPAKRHHTEVEESYRAQPFLPPPPSRFRFQPSPSTGQASSNSGTRRYQVRSPSGQQSSPHTNHRSNSSWDTTTTNGTSSFSTASIRSPASRAHPLHTPSSSLTSASTPLTQSLYHSPNSLHSNTSNLNSRQYPPAIPASYADLRSPPRTTDPMAFGSTPTFGSFKRRSPIRSPNRSGYNSNSNPRSNAAYHTTSTPSFQNSNLMSDVFDRDSGPWPADIDPTDVENSLPINHNNYHHTSTSTDFSFAHTPKFQLYSNGNNIPSPEAKGSPFRPSGRPSILPPSSTIDNSGNSAISPEALRYLASQQQVEDEHNRTIGRANTKLQDLIRQGQMALAAPIEVGDDYDDF